MGEEAKERTRARRTKRLRDERGRSVSPRDEDHHTDHLPDLVQHEALAVEAEGDPLGPVEDYGLADLAKKESEGELAPVTSNSLLRRSRTHVHLEHVPLRCPIVERPLDGIVVEVAARTKE